MRDLAVLRVTHTYTFRRVDSHTTRVLGQCVMESHGPEAGVAALRRFHDSLYGLRGDGDGEEKDITHENDTERDGCRHRNYK